MDITLARTFLEIVAAGSFIKASQRLNVTQSTVSTRVRSLEDLLGRQVFIRNKAGTELTLAGRQFLRYAVSLVKVWEEARQQVAVPPGYRTSLSIGVQYSLWDRFILKWLPRMEARLPDVALRAELGMPARLMREMVEGIVDIGVMYMPELRPGLQVEQLFEDELVLISASETPGHGLDSTYVYIDWGPEFHAAHAVTFPDHTNPGITLSLGVHGIGYVLENHRSGYFPRRSVQPFLDSGRAHIVPGAPVFPFPSYVVYDTSLEPDILEVALDELRQLAASVEERSEDAEILGIGRVIAQRLPSA